MTLVLVRNAFACVVVVVVVAFRRIPTCITEKVCGVTSRDSVKKYQNITSNKC